MAITLATLSPDTCGCSFVVEYDNAVPDSELVITPIPQLSLKCVFHTHLAQTTEWYNMVMGENKKKSDAFNEMIMNAPTSVYTLVNNNRVLKDGVTLTWSWSGTSPNVVLTFLLTGASLTNNQKTIIQQKLDSRFGVGNVVMTYG